MRSYCAGHRFMLYSVRSHQRIKGTSEGIMCGRYTLFEEREEGIYELRALIEEIKRRRDGEGVLKGMRTAGEICPGQYAPVIDQKGANVMLWGFPFGDSKSTYPNARSETVDKKFHHAFRNRRIVVPTTGFYEWNHPEAAASTDKRKKRKYHFTRPDHQGLYYMAGIYSPQAIDGSDEPVDRYVILTTAANESVAPYHDRMPVYLEAGEIADWLNDDDAALEIIRRPQPELRAEPVEPERDEPEQISFF